MKLVDTSDLGSGAERRNGSSPLSPKVVSMRHLNDADDDEITAQEYINEIDDMLLDEAYEFATDTLESIKSYALKHNRITDAQQRAVDNIREGGSNHANY